MKPAMKPVTLALSAVSFALATALAAGQPIETRGVIDSVTVYRGQALVTRAIDLAAPARPGALVEVVVTDLPSSMEPGTLYAESDGNVSIRSVRYRARPVSQDVREEVRKLDEQIAALTDRAHKNRRRVEVLNENRAYVNSLQQFVAPTATFEITRGVLNAQTLEQLTLFIIKQREDMAAKELELADEARAIGESIALAQRELSMLTAGAGKVVQEAVVFVSHDKPGAAQVKLRYLVNNATWEPSYTARAANLASGSQDKPKGITLEYYASVQQMSGEDWGDVAMTLSTATPSLIARAPALEPLTLILTGQPQPEQPTAGRGYSERKEELSNLQREVERQRAQIGNRNFVGQVTVGGGQQADPGSGLVALRDDDLMKKLNELANSAQVLDLAAGPRIPKSAAATRPRASQEGLAVTYALPGRTSLPSRIDNQLIQIAALPIGAEFSKVAVPSLTSFVYDEAKCTNGSGMVLLSGPVTAYADGAFVGSGEISTVSAGESFIVGFGIDSSLRASRELVERTESVQGGNRIVEITYRLAVENFGEAPASVRITDRIPRTSDSQIRVTLLSASQQPLEQSVRTADEPREGVRLSTRDGILRWNLAAPAKAGAANPATIEYKFRLEYDRQMSIVGM